MKAIHFNPDRECNRQQPGTIEERMTREDILASLNRRVACTVPFHFLNKFLNSSLVFGVSSLAATCPARPLIFLGTNVVASPTSCKWPPRRCPTTGGGGFAHPPCPPLGGPLPWPPLPGAPLPLPRGCCGPGYDEGFDFSTLNFRPRNSTSLCSMALPSPSSVSNST